MIAILDRHHAQVVRPRGTPMLHIPIRLACCPTCSRVPGSAETALCTRTDCGLADRHHHIGSNAA